MREEVVFTIRSAITLLLVLLFIPMGTGHSQKEVDLDLAVMEEPLANFELNGSGQYFIENHGQFDEKLCFIAVTDFGHVGIGTNGIYYHLIPSEIGINVQNENVIMTEFLEGNILEPVGKNELDMKMNFFIGNDEEKWASGVSVYESVEIPDIYDGISARYYFGNAGFKYDIILEPGTDPSSIMMRYHGHEDLEVKSDNIGLILDGGLRLNDGDLWTYSEGTGKDIGSKFVPVDEDTISFSLGEYDAEETIVIDPLVYSTYIGGTQSESVEYIKTIENGRIYLAGYTESIDFPTTPGAYDTIYSENTSYSPDLFVMRMDESGRYPDYSTFIGGNSVEQMYGFDVGSDGAAVLSTLSYSVDYPITSGSYNDSALISNYYAGAITKISPDGSSLIFSSYLWESSLIYDIEIDDSDRIVFTGYAHRDHMELKNKSMVSGTYPSDAVIGILSSDGTQLIHSSIIGGDGHDFGKKVIVENKKIIISGETYSKNFPNDTAWDNGKIYQTGIFICSFDLAEEKFDKKLLIWDQFTAAPELIAGDGDEIYIIGSSYTGFLNGTNDAIDIDHNGKQDMCIIRLDATWAGIDYLSYFGGPNEDIFSNGYFDDLGRLVLGGSVQDGGFPTTYDAWSKEMISSTDLFITLLDLENGTVFHSTIIGSTSGEYLKGFAEGPNGNILAGGRTWAWNQQFPTTDDAFQNGSELGGVSAFFFEYKLPIIAQPPTNLSYKVCYEDRGQPTGVNLSWTEPSDWGNGKPVGYMVYRWRDGEEPEVLNRGNLKNVTYYYDDLDNWYQDYIFKLNYMITAVTDSYTESYPSEEVQIDDLTGPWIHIYDFDGIDDPGTILDFRYDVEDPSEVQFVWIEFWYNDGIEHTQKLLWSYEPIRRENLEINPSLGKMEFMLHAYDRLGNKNSTEVYEVQLIDTIEPWVSQSFTPSNIEAGDMLKFKVQIYENHMMENVTLEFGYVDEGYTNVSMETVDDEHWTYDYVTRRRPDDIRYRIYGFDVSGNGFETDWKTINHRGDYRPIFGTDYTPGEVYIGETIPFKVQIIDHRDIDEAWVRIGELEIPLLHEGENNWTAPYDWRNGNTELKYDFTFRTIWNKTYSSGYFFINYIDTVNPYFLEFSDLTEANISTGTTYEFWAEAFDDFQVDRVRLNYETDRTFNHYYLDTVNGPRYSRDIKIPEDATVFRYWFTAIDLLGNFFNTSIIQLSVHDSIIPEFRGLNDRRIGTADEFNQLFEIRENIGIDQVEGEYWLYGNDPRDINIRYYSGDDNYRFTLYLDPNGLGPYFYKIYVWDSQGNMAESDAIRVDQYDNTDPRFTSEVKDQIFSANEEFTIKIDVSDNIGVNKVTWLGIPFERSTREITGSISERGIYHVTVIIEDYAGNKAETEFLLVIESEKVSCEKESDLLIAVMVILIIILLIIISILALNLNNMKKKSDEEMIEGPGIVDEPPFGSRFIDDLNQQTLDDMYE